MTLPVRLGSPKYTSVALTLSKQWSRQQHWGPTNTQPHTSRCTER